MPIVKEDFDIMMLRLQARVLKRFNEGLLKSSTAEFVTFNDPHYKNAFYREFVTRLADHPVDNLKHEHIKRFLEGFAKIYFKQNHVDDLDVLAQLMLEGIQQSLGSDAESIAEELIAAWTEAWDRHHREYPDEKPTLDSQKEFALLLSAKKEEQHRRQ